MKILLQIDEQNNITGYATVYPAGMDGVEIEIAGDDVTSLFFGESHTLYCLQDGAIVRRADAEAESERLRQEQNDIYKATAASAVQNMLDNAAKKKGYDSILSACSYAAYPNPFQAEGQEFVAWRGAVWAKCYEILGEVEAGTRTAPTVTELLAELATIVIPTTESGQ